MIQTAQPRLARSSAGSSGWFGWAGKLLAEELAPRPRRLRTSVRLALIGTIGAGLIAACHVHSALGPYAVWLMIGDTAMLSYGLAATYLVVAAPILAVSVPLAGILVEAPWLLLPFIGLFTTVSTYLTVTRKLAPFGLLMQVLVLDGFYGAVFAPREFGSADASTYGACVIAFILIAAFDNFIWPDPAEAILLESLSGSVRRQRDRFVIDTRFFLDETAIRPMEPKLTSEMPLQLTILERAVTEGISFNRRAILVAAITRAERFHIFTNRLAIVVREDVPHVVRTLLHPEIDNACIAIAAAMDEIARDPVMTSDPGLPPTPAIARVSRAMETLAARTIEVRPRYIGRASGVELANLGAFLENISSHARLLEASLEAAPPAAKPAPARKSAPVRNPATVRYSYKVALSIVIAYSTGLFTQQADLTTILTTTIISGQPTYGGTLRKMVLRNIGALLGGVVSLLAIIIVTPNFETLPAYMLVVFVVLLVSAYASLSSGRVAYAGKQIGVTFMLVFAGLSPARDIYSPLWRIWGILLGTIVVMVVFFLLWPEYAGDSLLPRLRRVIRDTLALAPGGSATADEETIERTENEITTQLAEILQVADDARLEGRRSLIDHEAVVQAASHLRRISSWNSTMAKWSLAAPLPRLDDATEAAHDATLAAMRRTIEAWLAFYQSGQWRSRRAAQALAARFSRDEIAEPLAEFSNRLEADGFARISSWTFEQRGQILARVQALHRLEFLIFELNTDLSMVPGATSPAALVSVAQPSRQYSS
ncbi:MAG TPA: FUSC family protein [Candidatus Binataceae bacterium]